MGSSDLDEAIGRMREAIDRLETAIDMRRRHDARRADSDEEFTIMQDDRARLAVELDGAYHWINGSSQMVVMPPATPPPSVSASLHQFSLAPAGAFEVTF